MGNANCCEAPLDRETSSAEVVEKVPDKPIEKLPEPSPAPEEPEPSPEVKTDEDVQPAEVATDATVAAAEEPLAKPKPTLEIVFSEKEKDVTIIFEQRPLGLGFGQAPAPGCCAAKPSSKAIVTTVDAKKDILKGVKAGMCFKSINGTDVREMEWTDFQALLRDAQQKIPKA